MRIEWKRKIMIAGIAVGVFVGYRYLLPMAIPFLTAWALASWLEPVAAKVERRTKLRKGFVGAALLAAVFGTLGVLFYLGAAELFAQVRTAVVRMPKLLAGCMRLLDDCCGALERSTGILREDSKSYILNQMDALQEHMLALAGPQTMKWAKKLLFFMSGLVVTFISTLLIMGDMERLRRKIWDYSWLVGTRRIVRRLHKTTVTYLKAQAVIILIVGAVCAAGFWLMKSPYYLIFGILLGLFDAVPLIGTGTFLYPAAVVFLIKGNGIAAVICVLLDVITSLLREFLEPKLLGTKLGVSPLSVLASVYLGILLFGAWGVILGPLSFSTTYEIGKEWDIWD